MTRKVKSVEHYITWTTDDKPQTETSNFKMNEGPYFGYMLSYLIDSYAIFDSNNSSKGQFEKSFSVR